MKRRCRTCDYWQPEEGRKNRGECRWNAPVVDNGEGRWPHAWAYDWCAEWDLSDAAKLDEGESDG